MAEHLTVPPPMKRLRLASGPTAAAAAPPGTTVSTGGPDPHSPLTTPPPPLSALTPVGPLAFTGTAPGTPPAFNCTALAPPMMPDTIAGFGQQGAWAQPFGLAAALHPPPAPVLVPVALPGASSSSSSVAGSTVGGSSPRAAGGGGGGRVSSAPRDGRASGRSPEQKVGALLRRFPRSFCEDLQIDMASSTPEALWQWLCVSVLMSARIKSNAALGACHALLRAGLTSAAAFCAAGQERVKDILVKSGYDRYDDKTAGFLVADAEAVQREYGGDLNRLRQAAGCNAAQERALLKRLRGVGDGAVDIFFRQAQVAWEELFPFADKKSLKAARLVGLKEHPQALADLCGGERAKLARVLAALAAVDMSRAHADF